jgi:hypothetical protein
VKCFVNTVIYKKKKKEKVPRLGSRRVASQAPDDAATTILHWLSTDRSQGHFVCAPVPFLLLLGAAVVEITVCEVLHN